MDRYKHVDDISARTLYWLYLTMASNSEDVPGARYKTRYRKRAQIYANILRHANASIWGPIDKVGK